MIQAVPKIIHQIWVGKNPIPKKALVLRDKVLCLHKTWRHFLWTDYTVSLISNKLPKVYYDSENTGYKSDILRYYLMYEFGGIYLDMDIDMNKNMNELLKIGAFVVANPQETIKFVPDETIQNAVLGSDVKNPFFGFLLNQLPLWCKSKNRSNFITTNGRSENCITVKTGPIFLSLMFKRYQSIFLSVPITILPSYYFYPYSGFFKKESGKFPESYGIHRWWGTWA